MRHKQKLKWLTGVTFACLGCLWTTTSQETIEASRLGATHIGTFEGGTTFTASSENGIPPELFLEVVDGEGNLAQYKSEGGAITVPDTKEGATVKRAILTGNTLTNLVDASEDVTIENYDGYANVALTSALTPNEPIIGGMRYTVYFKAMDVLSPRSTNMQYQGRDLPNNAFYKYTAVSGYAIKEGWNVFDFTVKEGLEIRYIQLLSYMCFEEGGGAKILGDSIMIIEGNHTDKTIPYFEGTQSVQTPFLSISNIDGSKTSTIALPNDLVLRSNGEVSDELDLITGTLTQRIDENNEVLPQEVVTTVDLSATHQFPLLDKSFIQVNGTIPPVITSITVPTDELSFVLDPNQEIGQQFIAPEFEVTNESNAPLALTLKTFEQTTDVFNDVLPETYESWDGLTKEQSKDIALGLVTQPSDDWLDVVEDPHYVSETNNNLLGTIKPKGTVGFEFIAHHGQAFDEILNPSYRLTFIFDLLN